MLEEAGCDLLWMPSVDDIYPRGLFDLDPSSRGVSDRWEGEARPGHFDGVATIVAKLLLAVRPDVALFGEKDFQQLAVIRRMVEDLTSRPRSSAVPTVREEDGLALSSRNAYLSADERGARARAASGAAIMRAMRSSTARRSRLALETGEEVAHRSRLFENRLFRAGRRRHAGAARSAGGHMRLIAAAAIGTTRLIDNLAL